LRPRGADVPAAEGTRRRGRVAEAADVADVERDQPDAVLIAGEERAEAEVDASLRPLARALLALAEQLSREEGP
jgi:hypothetical protein